MKKNILLFIVLLIFGTLNAQAPKKFNFQGVARNSLGIILPAQNISIRTSVLEGSATGAVEYSEIHNTKTNILGLFTLAIGEGKVSSGTFDDINWSTGLKFLKIEIDIKGGSNYELVSTTQLLSVPYALYAENGSQWLDTDDGIFYQKNVGIGTNNINKNINNNSGDLYPNLGWNGLHLKSDLHSLLTIEGNERSRIHFASNSSNPNSRNYVIEVSNNFGSNNSSYLNIASLNDDLSTKSRGIVLHENGNVGIGGMLYDVPTPKSKLQVTGGDIFIEDVSKGVIMKSPNGNCWRMTISNSGQPEINSITCPN